jgi:hypothetical protein
LVSGQLQHIFLPDLPIFGPPSGGVGDGGGGLDDVNGHIYNPIAIGSSVRWGNVFFVHKNNV